MRFVVLEENFRSWRFDNRRVEECALPYQIVQESRSQRHSREKYAKWTLLCDTEFQDHVGASPHEARLAAFARRQAKHDERANMFITGSNIVHKIRTDDLNPSDPHINPPYFSSSGPFKISKAPKRKLS
jgi:hypothetical protein